MTLSREAVSHRQPSISEPTDIFLTEMRIVNSLSPHFLFPPLSFTQSRAQPNDSLSNGAKSWLGLGHCK